MTTLVDRSEHLARVVAVDPRSDPRWLRVVRARGSLFTSPRWIRAVCDFYGFPVEGRLLLDGGGEPRAGVAWAVVEDFRGRRAVALPFSDRSDPPAEPADWPALRESLPTDLPLRLRVLADHAAALDPQLIPTGEAAWHSTALEGTAAEMLAGLDGRVRRALRRGAEHGIRVEIGTAQADVRRFHDLHVRLRKDKYAMLAPPAELFEAIAAGFAPDDDLAVVTARVDEQVAGAAVFLLENGTLYYKYGASRPDLLDARPNEAIAWAAIRWGLERGATSVDWGVSDLDQPGLIRYKRKWASVESRVVTLANHPTPPDTAGPLLAELTALFTRATVPTDVTAAAGAALYRYFC